MSKYSRARTPPSPPPISKKSSPSRHSSKNYDIPSKSYREYDKYDDQPDNYKRAKFDKSDKRDRYDKFEKSDFKSTYSTATREYNQSSYASNLSKKSSRSDKGVEKSDPSYRDVSIPYKSKVSLYAEDRYSGRDSYVSKYVSSEAERYSKYASPSKDLPSNNKYSSKSLNTDFTSASSNRRYSPYLLNKNSSSTSYTKLEADPYYGNDGEQSYSSYRGIKNMSGRSVVEGGPERVSHRGDSTKTYANHELSSNSHNYYERYVIGDSVVYGSPGHYPRDIYTPSPKSKSRRSPPSPPPLPSLSKNSTYGKHSSRYSPASPKRFRSKSPVRGSSPYSSRLKSPMRRPPSPPPPLLSSFRNLSPIRYSRNDKQRRNCTPPLQSGRDKGNRYDERKRTDVKDNDRRNRFKELNSFRDKGSSYASYDNGPLRGSGKDVPLRPSRPIGSPKPLLSIPLTLHNVPKESRANVRETLCLGEPRGRKGEKIGPGKMRRFEGRIGPVPHGLNHGRTLPNRNRAISPGERKKRRPDDLRLWIESRKTVGRKKVSSPVAKSSRHTLQKRLPRGGAILPTNRRRLNDSTRRILNKGKRRTQALPIRKGLKVRRPPLKPRNNDDHSSRRSKDKTTKREDRAPKIVMESRKVDSVKKNVRKEGKTNGNRSRSKERNAPGSSANTHRVIKRPKVVSNANSLPVKPRPVKKTTRKSPSEQNRSIVRSSKFHPRTTSREKSQSPRKGERSPRREKSPRRNERSPRRDEK